MSARSLSARAIPVVLGPPSATDCWPRSSAPTERDRRLYGARPFCPEGGGYAGWHVKDPDGLDVQIGGLVKPGDSLYGDKLSEFPP